MKITCNDDNGLCCVKGRDDCEFTHNIGFIFVEISWRSVNITDYYIYSERTTSYFYKLSFQM